MKTKRKSSKPTRRLAPGFDHGNTSLVILIVLVVAIVAGGIGFMLARKTEVPTKKPVAMQQPVAQPAQSVAPRVTDETANWKVYTNSKLGISFKYPTDWKINMPNDINEFIEINLVSPETERNVQELGEYPSADIVVAVRDSIACFAPNCSGKWKNLNEYLRDSEKEGDIGGVREISVGSLKAYEAGKVGMGGHYTIYMENKTAFLEIDFTLRESMKELTNIESKILSTFKFTN